MLGSCNCPFKGESNLFGGAFSFVLSLKCLHVFFVLFFSLHI